MSTVTGSILATYEPEDDEEGDKWRDVRIWYRARGEFRGARSRLRYYHPNDPDGPGDDLDIELEGVDVIDVHKNKTGETPSPELIAWCDKELRERYWSIREDAYDNSGPDPDAWYDAKMSGDLDD